MGLMTAAAAQSRAGETRFSPQPASPIAATQAARWAAMRGPGGSEGPSVTQGIQATPPGFLATPRPGDWPGSDYRYVHT